MKIQPLIPLETIAGSLLLGSLLVIAPQAAADTTDNPCQIIINKNVFRLNPPPPLRPEPQSVKPPKPKITLTGITTILPTKRALMTVAAPPKPGDPPNAQRSCILAEGQQEGGIEVIEINEKANTVSIRYDDEPMTLTFDPVKPNSSGPGPGPGPTAMAANNAVPNAAPQAVRMMPPRRFPPNPAQHVAPMPTPATAANPNPDNQKPEATAAQPLTSDQQALLQEVERELHKTDPGSISDLSTSPSP